MSRQEIVKELRKSELCNLGFKVVFDKDNNIEFEKDTELIYYRIGLPYSNNSYSRNIFTFYSALTTLCFKKIEKLYTDLCYEAIKGKISAPLIDCQIKDYYYSPTTSINIQVKTPNGPIKSVFNYLNIGDIYPFDNTDNIDLYVEYLNKYYIDCALPFFNSIPDIQTLDKMTDGKDEFEIALYLSNFSELKKIILSNLTNNPNKDIYFYNFKNEMETNYSIPTIPIQSKEQILAILSSLKKIKKYFGIN